MGIHKNIRDLNPLVLYTFDRLESYIDPDTGDGYCVNRTEYDFPPLMIRNSGLFFKDLKLKTLQPALSEVEQNTKYQSFSSGPPNYVSMGYTDKNLLPKPAYEYKLNNGSVYANANLYEQMSLISSNYSPYTVFFQFAATPHATSSNGGASISAPYYRLSPTINTVAYAGHFSYFELSGVDNKLLGSYDEDAVSIGFGYSSDTYEHNVLVPQRISFGMGSVANIKYTEGYLKENDTIPYPYSMYYGESYTVNRSVKVFQFGHILIYATRSNNDTVTLSMYQYNATNNAAIASCKDGEILSIFLVVKPTNGLNSHVDVYVNGRYATTVSVYSSWNINDPSNYYTSKLHLGIESEWVEAKSNIKDLELGFTLYESISPNMTVKFDNVSIFNRAITLDEMQLIYYTNYNYISIFKLFGYNQLYDFSELYSPSSVRYIEDNTVLNNILGGTSYLTVQSHQDYLPYVVKNNATDIEYTFKCTKYCSLQSQRTSYGNPTSMVRSGTGTISFMFKTSDEHGILFANSLYERSAYNFVLLLSYGYLEVWVADDLAVRISDIANNEWHTMFITFGSTTSFYIDKVLYYKHPGALINTGAMTLFGNGIPGNNDLEVDFALIGVSSKQLLPEDIGVFIDASKVAYSTRGQITLNNIAVGTNVFIYNRHSGALIEKIQSDSADGTFTYVNRYPYTISVIVADSTLLIGKSYIVDPVEIE